MEPRKRAYHVVMVALFGAGAYHLVNVGAAAWIWLPLMLVLAHGIALVEDRTA
jgi:hypothetical protein